MKKLLKGILDFKKNLTDEQREAFGKLALGQSPDALLIACSDSRVVPNLFASTDPGDLFVMRNVGNIVPSCDSSGSTGDKSEGAAVEFSTISLNVSDVIVCGHSECGAMKALMSRAAISSHPHLCEWLEEATDALGDLEDNNTSRLEATPDLSDQNRLSQLSVLRQLDHLETYPSIKARLADGSLKLHAWWFDIGAAEVLAYDPADKRFSPLDQERISRLI